MSQCHDVLTRKRKIIEYTPFKIKTRKMVTLVDVVGATKKQRSVNATTLLSA